LRTGWLNPKLDDASLIARVLELATLEFDQRLPAKR
jgi:hypothetical protein